MPATMRLHRALARAGLASRRKAEVLIGEGRVRVNGQLAHVGQGVNPSSDVVELDGRRVDLATAAPVWMVLHKPVGYMTTRSDPQGRRTMFELVDDVPGLVYVGRLDLETEGVLLLTTDGDAANRLTHPSAQVERVYQATVTGDAPAAARVVRRGVMLQDGLVRPKRVTVRAAGDDRWHFEVVITEGRKREVRRLCREVGLRVERLVRTAFGPVTLGMLPAGASRPLTARERGSLARLLGRSLDGPAG
ncbi:MAG TPA: pseudouridine synthase [Gemmatimonadaceae bacterium]